MPVGIVRSAAFREPYDCGIADYVREIRSVQPAGPYYLLGECIGGIVAYEIACQLRKQNQEVALLIMMDTFRPTRIKYLHYCFGQLINRWKSRYYAIAHNYYVNRMIFHWNVLLQISWRQKGAYLMNISNMGLMELPNILAARNQIEENTSSQAIQYSRQAQEPYLRTLRRHKPKPYDGKILMVTNEKLYSRNPTAGWADLAPGGIDVRKVSGAHDTYIHDNIKSTAKLFKAYLLSVRNAQ